MKRFVGIVKACALLDVILITAWLVTLAVNPTLAAHVMFVSLAGAAAILAGALLSAPLWLPLGVLIMALVTGNSIIGFVSNHVPEAVGNFKQKLFGGVQ
jgi:hypothetical protein